MAHGEDDSSAPHGGAGPAGSGKPTSGVRQGRPAGGMAGIDGRTVRGAAA
ncbi:hypothetical protein [Streptomyces sp. NPDC086777]